jgi:hypothetical protein
MRAPLATPSAGPSLAQLPPVPQALIRAALAEDGTPVERPVRSALEQRFGHDFTQVAIHTGTRAAQAASALNARAFTAGDHLYFGAGQYQPATPAGRALLFHEATHVVQQRLRYAVGSSGAAESEARLQAFAPIGPAPRPVRIARPVGIACEDKGPTAAHAGGAMGELDAGFGLGKLGFDIVLGPAGPGGHKLTANGLDIVAYNPKTGELLLVDNKASGGTKPVGDASAITRNLRESLNSAIAEVKALDPFPHQKAIVGMLEATRAALRGKGRGKAKLPAAVTLVVTNAGGFHERISKKLEKKGIKFIDLVGKQTREARRRDIAAAEAAGKATGRPTSHEGTAKAAAAAQAADKAGPAAAPARKSPSRPTPKNTEFNTAGKVIHTEGDGTQPPPTRGASIKPTRPQKFRAGGAGLAELMPAAMAALQDKVIRHRVAVNMLGMWPKVERFRREFPDHKIIFFVSLQEWAKPDDTGNVARAVNYVDVFHGATEDDVLASASSLLRSPVPEGWVEVGPFFGVIEPLQSLEEAKDYAKSQEGCFIATACCGSENAEPVRVLRAWRDRWLLQRAWGRRFVRWYYLHSPPVARWLSEHEWARRCVRMCFVLPVAAAVEASGLASPADLATTDRCSTSPS